MPRQRMLSVPSTSADVTEKFAGIASLVLFLSSMASAFGCLTLSMDIQRCLSRRVAHTFRGAPRP